MQAPEISPGELWYNILREGMITMNEAQLEDQMMGAIKEKVVAWIAKQMNGEGLPTGATLDMCLEDFFQEAYCDQI